MSTTRIDRIVSAFLRSDYWDSWQAENMEQCMISQDPFKRDRVDRVYAAAEDGADGSTYREAIDDMRHAFGDWLRYEKENRRLPFAEFRYRLQAAADRHFDSLETWHETHGTLDQQIG